MKKTFLLLLACAVIACSDDTPDTFENRLSGYYAITFIASDIPVDLNNDGAKSFYLYSEFSGTHYAPDGSLLTPHQFDAPWNLMEVRPLPESANDGKLIAINFPNQLLGELSDGTYYLMDYGHSFIHYSYELDDNMDIELSAPPFEGDRGTLHNLEFISDGRLELTLTKQLFDFEEQKWVDANLTVRYERVEVQ